MPKRAPRGAADLASARKPLVRSQPGGCTVVIVADQVGGQREPLQVLRLEGHVSLRRRHQGVGIGPRLLLQCLTPRSRVSAVVISSPPDRPVGDALRRKRRTVPCLSAPHYLRSWPVRRVEPVARRSSSPATIPVARLLLGLSSTAACLKTRRRRNKRDYFMLSQIPWFSGRSGAILVLASATHVKRSQNPSQNHRPFSPARRRVLKDGGLRSLPASSPVPGTGFIIHPRLTHPLA